MGDWPNTRFLLSGGTITSAGMESQLGQINLFMNTLFNSVVTAWGVGVANTAFYILFSLESPVTVYQIAVENGGTVAGNLDVGIYDYVGNLLVSSGTTPMAGASAIQAVNIADTALGPGNYYMAMSTDSTTATYRCSTQAAVRLRIGRAYTQTTAFPLPNPATFANCTVAFVPYISLATKSTI